jgi:dolichyl-phosphate beta-glucosyltransferase
MEQSTEVFLSVVIPQYNEKSNLDRGVLDEVREYLMKQAYSWEVIISDDGSSDGSMEFSRNYVSKYDGFDAIQGKHGGKAMALLNGIREAKGRFILITDMDQSTPLNQLEKLLPFIDKNYDIVIGSRGLKRDNAPLFRKAAGAIFGNVRRALALRKISDTQCGFKLFRTDVAKLLFPKLDAVVPVEDTSGWKVSAFDVELLYMAQKMGYKIKEVKVDWQDEDTSKTKEKKFVKESVDMFQQILKVRVNDFKGKYNSKVVSSK